MNTSDRDSEAAAEPRSARCSFCRTTYHDVGSLIEGPTINGFQAYICRDCVELCAAIFEQEKLKKSATQNQAAESRLKEALGAVLESLTDIEREVVKLRYGLSDGYSYNSTH